MAGYRWCYPLIFVAAAVAGQTLQQPPAPPLSSNMLQDLRLDPARRSTLQSQMARHEYAAAEDLLAEEAKRDPKSQPILLALANVLFLDGKQLNSAVVLKKAEKLGPLDERNQLLLALAYIAIGRLNWARPELEKLVQAHPSNAVYPYWLARIAYRKMDIQAAVAHAQKAIQLDPAFMKAYDQLGLCYEAAGNSEQAIKEFEEAIRLNAQLPVRSPWPAVNLGSLLLRMNKLNEAELQFRNSVSIDPHFPVAHFRLGQVLEKKAQYQDAIAELQQAAALDPTYPEPHYALGRVLRNQGDLKTAAREFSTFEDLRKTDKRKGITRPD